MTARVEVDPNLAARAEAAATARGENLEDVIARALTEYVEEPPKV